MHFLHRVKLVCVYMFAPQVDNERLRGQSSYSLTHVHQMAVLQLTWTFTMIGSRPMRQRPFALFVLRALL